MIWGFKDIWSFCDAISLEMESDQHTSLYKPIDILDTKQVVSNRNGEERFSKLVEI